MSDETNQITTLTIELARMDERLKASDKALTLAQDALSKWQGLRDQWRQELETHCAAFVTTDKIMAIIGVGIAVVTLALKFIR